MDEGAAPTHACIHVVSSKHQQVQMKSCTFGVCPLDPMAHSVTEYWVERISNDGELVHENPDSISALGTSNISLGGISLDAADRQWIIAHFHPGDVVLVNNSGRPTLPVWGLYGNWAVPWPQWKAGNSGNWAADTAAQPAPALRPALMPPPLPGDTTLASRLAIGYR